MDLESTSGADSALVDVLLARIDGIEARLQTATAAIDEKSLKEFRRTVEAISKRDPKFEERVTDRVDVIADRIETVTRTVSTTSAALAAKDGEIAQLHRELEGTFARVSAALADAPRGPDASELAEIKRALAELSKQKLPRGLDGRIEDLVAKVGLLAQRVDTVSSTVSTTAAGLAGRDGDVTSLRRAHEADVERIGAEIAGLRRAVDPALAELQQAVKQLHDETAAHRLAYQRWFEQASGKVNGLTSGLSELRESVESQATGAAAREQAAADAARVLADQTSAVGTRVDDLGSRLDSLHETAATTSSRLETKDAQIETMEQRFGETTSRVDGLVGELMRALDELPDPHVLEARLHARIDELGDRFVKFGERLDRTEATMPERLREVTSAAEALDRMLVDQRGRVESLAARLEASTASTEEWISGSRDELAALRAFAEEGATHLTTAVGELRSSVETVSAQVAALEQADGGAAAKKLDERISSVARTVDELASGLTSALARVAGSEEELGSVRAFVETGGTRLGSHISDLKQQVTTLRDQLTGLERADGDVGDRVSNLGTSVHRLDGRLSEATGALTALSQRGDALATNVESAVVSLSDKQRELTEIHRHFTESSARIETVAEDIRDALGALPDASPETFEALTSKLEAMAGGMTSLAGRLERLEAVNVDQVAAELTQRFDRIDSRIGAVVAEMGRAKTLWPVALRSLEARLDDLVSHAHVPDPGESEVPEPEPAGESDDLLAGLRDGLQAMENVAEDMARASEAWGSEGDTSAQETHEAAAGGARIVHLRVSEP